MEVLHSLMWRFLYFCQYPIFIVDANFLWPTASGLGLKALPGRKPSERWLKRFQGGASGRFSLRAIDWQAS